MNIKNNILFIHSYLTIGGTESVLINYLNFLANNDNYRITLLLDEYDLTNIEKINNKVNIQFILNKFESQFSRLSYWKSIDSSLEQSERNYYYSWNQEIYNDKSERIANFIKNGNFSLIINFNGHLNRFIQEDYVYKYMKNIPIISWIHGQYYLDRWKESPKDYNTIVSRTSAFITVCKDMQNNCHDILKNYFNLSHIPVYMIYNPLDIIHIKNMKNNFNEEDMNLLNDNYILQVSRLDETTKNHLQMIDIYYQLKQKGIKHKLYFVGDGDSKSVLLDRVISLGLENDCLFLGSKINPFPLMKNAKLFIHTSKSEGFGLVLVESMICGTPVVAYDCPTGPREILNNGEYGELIPMGDVPQFVDKTYNLLTNESALNKFKEKLPKAVERFSMETIGKQFNQLIHEYCGS